VNVVDGSESTAILSVRLNVFYWIAFAIRSSVSDNARTILSLVNFHFLFLSLDYSLAWGTDIYLAILVTEL
jgi:hypothetical protein